MLITQANQAASPLAGLTSRMAQLLETRGWTVLDSTAIALKEFNTAVGPKEAHAYVQDFGPGNDSVMLAGVYYSEGRNILEPLGRLVPRDADDVRLDQEAAAFAQHVERAVAQSYAAKLLTRQ